jgi:hypothetical protein
MRLAIVVVVLVGCASCRSARTPPEQAVPPEAPGEMAQRSADSGDIDGGHGDANGAKSPEVVRAPVVFSVGTGGIVGGWSAEVSEDGSVEGRAYGLEVGDGEPRTCTARLALPGVLAHARSLARCCAMKVPSLRTSELPADQRWVEVRLEGKTCRTVQSERVWRNDPEARACRNALADLRRDTCEP